VKRRKLAGKVTGGRGKLGSVGYEIRMPMTGTEVGSAGRAGIVVDGELYRLGGEPPTATTKGWGKVPGQ
jgi:hypothetical protein